MSLLIQHLFFICLLRNVTLTQKLYLQLKHRLHLLFRLDVPKAFWFGTLISLYHACHFGRVSGERMLVTFVLGKATLTFVPFPTQVTPVDFALNGGVGLVQLGSWHWVPCLDC